MFFNIIIILFLFVIAIAIVLRFKSPAIFNRVIGMKGAISVIFKVVRKMFPKDRDVSQGVLKTICGHCNAVMKEESIDGPGVVSDGVCVSCSAKSVTSFKWVIEQERIGKGVMKKTFIVAKVLLLVSFLNLIASYFHYPDLIEFSLIAFAWIGVVHGLLVMWATWEKSVQLTVKYGSILNIFLGGFAIYYHIETGDPYWSWIFLGMWVCINWLRYKKILTDFISMK